MNTTKYILDKYKLLPIIEIPDVGRHNLAELFNEMGFKIGVEVGVCDGSYSEILCGANPGLKLFGIDPWLTYPEYNDYRHQTSLDKMFKLAKEKMAKYPAYEFIKATSMDAVKDFIDDSLDFVYIDANHGYKFVMEDIVCWSKKVKKGGIVSGHDYMRHMDAKPYDVIRAVNDYVRENKINHLFILGAKERHKTPGEIRDKERSWFFIKQ